MIPGFSQDLGRLGLMTRISIGKVVDVHPEQNTVDVRLATDNRKLVSVPVATLGNSGNTGYIDLPIPDLTTARSDPPKWKSDNVDNGRRDILAVIAFADGAPVCLGFVLPPVSQMTFPKEIGEEFRIDRHASDLYTTVDRDANHEWYHPSGTFIRIAENPEHLDLTAKDLDKKWKIKRNTSRAPYVRLVVANKGARVADIKITPHGDVEVWSKGNIKMTAAKIDLEGVVSINGIVQQGN